MSRIYLVGIGPGNREHMTEAAFAAMEKSDILCGYTVYIKLVQEHFPDKETYTTSMRQGALLFHGLSDKVSCAVI